MALAPLYLLARVKAEHSALRAAARGLGVNDGFARLYCALRAKAPLLAQAFLELLEPAVSRPEYKGFLHRLPGRVNPRGQTPPGRARAQHVATRIDHAAPVVQRRPAARAVRLL